jgi:hypothetical protein
MEVIHIPEEHTLVELSGAELHALWKAWRSVLDGIDEDSFGWKFDMTRDGAWTLNHRLSEALDATRHVQSE